MNGLIVVSVYLVPPKPEVPPSENTVFTSSPYTQGCAIRTATTAGPSPQTLEPRFLFVMVGSSAIVPMPQVQPSMSWVGERKAENVVGPSPKGGTVAAGWNDGLQTSGSMVRVITFQSWLIWIGITG